MLVAEAGRLKLDGATGLKDFSMEYLCAEYNGTGPDWIPGELVGKYTVRYPELEPAAFIHDIDFAESCGCGTKLREANDRFYRNCVRAARAMYGRWHPRYAKLMARAKAYKWLLRNFTFAACDKYALCALCIVAILLLCGCKAAVSDAPEPQFPQIERWWK